MDGRSKHRAMVSRVNPLCAALAAGPAISGVVLRGHGCHRRSVQRNSSTRNVARQPRTINRHPAPQNQGVRPRNQAIAPVAKNIRSHNGRADSRTMQRRPKLETFVNSCTYGRSSRRKQGTFQRVRDRKRRDQQHHKPKGQPETRGGAGGLALRERYLARQHPTQ